MMTSKLLRNIAVHTLLVSAVVLAGCSKTVPNVVGQAQDAAIVGITGAGLAVGTVTQAYSATVAPGTVISQIPAGGASAASGSAVALTVSQGPQPVTVPNLVGMPQVAATTAITGAGLTLGTVTQAYSATVASGTVISQAPVPGTSASPGAAVALIVSAGPPTETVPNVVGETQDAASAAITDAGLTVGTVTQAYSETAPLGSIISQNPVAGTSAATGTAVLLTVSQGPQPVVVPNVMNMPQTIASAVVTGANLAIGVITQAYSTTIVPGYVISQSPTGGSSVPPGTLVAMIVSAGPQPVTVPNVVGIEQEAASATIAATGLTVGTVTQAYSPTYASGYVISQSPTSGSLALPNDAVALTVSQGPEPVTVPNVVGMTQATANTTITGALLALGAITEVYSKTVAAGYVIAQNPSGGSNALPGTAVALTVSEGPQPVTVPDVVGMAQAAANAAITGAGLEVGTVTQTYSATVAPGVVIAQNPIGGSSVLPGSTVAITVSQGPPPVSVPNVVGLAQTRAATVIANAGLAVGTVTQVYSTTTAPGLVVSQDPVGGTKISRGSAIALVISQGPQPVTVPIVVGLTQTAAATAITDAGLFVGTVTQEYSGTVAQGLVISQDPSGGGIVPGGSAIALVVSLGPQSLTVPHVEGFTMDTARSKLLGATLTIGTATLAYSEKIALGFVIAQDPAGGTSALTGNAVALTISRGLEPDPTQSFVQFGYGCLTQIAVSPDGTKILTGSSDGNARLWDIAAGAVLQTFAGHSAGVTSVAFSPDGTKVLTGSADFTAKLWDVSTGVLIQTFTDPWGVNSVAFSPDGENALTGSGDYTAKLWNGATGIVLRTFTGHTESVRSAAFSLDGTEVLTAADDNISKLWDAATGNVLQTFNARVASESLISVAFSPDGPRVLTESSTDKLTLRNMRTGIVLQTFTGHTKSVLCAVFSPEGEKLLTGSYDNSAKLWDTATGAVLRTFTGYAAGVSSVALAPDANEALTGSRDSAPKLWDAATGTVLRTFSGHKGAIDSVSVSPEGTSVLTGSEDSTATLWEAATGAMLRVFTGHTKAVKSVAFSPDGTKIITGGGDSKAKLWDAATGALLRTLGHGASVNSVAFSPDGTMVLTGAGERTYECPTFGPCEFVVLDPAARLWDAVTGSAVQTFRLPGPVYAAVFSPDGTEIITGAGSGSLFWSMDDRMLELWSTMSGAALRTFTTQIIPVNSVAFSPDGTRVLTGSGESKAKLWDPGTATVLQEFAGQANSVAFHPDGTKVLTGSDDSTVKLWDVASGAVLQTFTGHTGRVNSVAFSPDGTKILTGSDDGTARLWGVE